MNEEKRRRIGKEIYLLRKKAGWSGRELGERSGVTQATISRIENGRRVSGVEVIKKIIFSLSLDFETANRLYLEAQEVYAEVDKRRIDSGFSLKLEAVYKLERGTSSVWGFQSAVIPRLLRTVDYAKAAGARDLGVTGALDDGERDFRFVLTEGALRTWPGSGSVMSTQLDHLVAVSQRANVWLGVVPWSVPLGVVPPHGFTVYGDEAVLVETFTAEVTIANPDDVAAYRDAFAAVERAAVVGDEARALLAAVRADFGKLIH